MDPRRRRLADHSDRPSLLLSVSGSVAFLNARTEYCHEGNLQRRAFHCPPDSAGLESTAAIEGMAAEIAECSHLDPQTGGREHTGNGSSISKSQACPQWHTFLQQYYTS